MNRRHFLGQVVLGSAAVAALGRDTRAIQIASGGLTINFVGLMFYLTRTDRSVLVALPGTHPMGHYDHVTFMMARAGTPAAAALGMTPMSTVVPGAFDMRLANELSGAFVFRCLEGIDLEVEPADGVAAVDHRADQIAQLDVIAPGKRVRGDLQRWSRATVALRGGRLDNAAAHPDAGKVWSFGSHRQRLTDATRYYNPAATLRLASGREVSALTADAARPAEIWIVSAAGPRTDAPNPRRLEHASLLFEFLSGATPVIATCDEAEGRITFPTELPCQSMMVAGLRAGFVSADPPHSELCPGGGSQCCN